MSSLSGKQTGQPLGKLWEKEKEADATVLIQATDSDRRTVLYRALLCVFKNQTTFYYDSVQVKASEDPLLYFTAT